MPQASSPASSQFFITSPSSCYGVVKSFGPFLECWEQQHDYFTDADNRMCAIEHFVGCSVFRSTFNNYHRPSQCSMWLERAIHCSVRHLCEHQCYLKAYLPVREWSKLRATLHKQIYERDFSSAAPSKMSHIKRKQSVDDVLYGWKCKLATKMSMEQLQTDRKQKQRASSYSTIFISPKGKIFTSAAQVLKYLHQVARVESNFIPTQCVYGDDCLRKSSISTKRKLIFSNEKKRQSKAATLSTTDSRCGASMENYQLTTFKLVGCPLASPYGLLEELFGNSPWKLLIAAILLNRTTRSHQGVDAVMHAFLSRWPDPVMISTKSCEGEIATLLRPLGLHVKRSKLIVAFSKEYLKLLSIKRQQIASTRPKSRSQSCCPYIGAPCFVHKLAFTNGLGQRVRVSCQTLIQDSPENEVGSRSKYFVRASAPCSCHCCAADCELTYPEFHLQDEEVLKLPCCGQYALDVYVLFVRKELQTPLSNDRALMSYVEYQRALYGLDNYAKS
mmetsp:Transcript_27662/g.39561  ORF Transcript_27662/g.39561 Transcript_27662/m.39561 type:complete len:502 (+) Transcript_27662:130-1635(+)